MTQEDIIRMALEALAPTSTQCEKQPAQEPVAYEYCDEVFWHTNPSLNDYIRANGKALVYTTPQQRPWVSLTDEEIESALGNYQGWREFARHLENILKEKND